ncbi:MAG: hypothetical protein ACT4QC_21910, partial [Planctomycetaceae bacterium]
RERVCALVPSPWSQVPNERSHAVQMEVTQQRCVCASLDAPYIYYVYVSAHDNSSLSVAVPESTERPYLNGTNEEKISK